MWLVIVMSLLFAGAYGCFIAYWITRKKQKIKAQNILFYVGISLGILLIGIVFGFSLSFSFTTNSPDVFEILGISDSFESIVVLLWVVFTFTMLPALLYSYYRFYFDRKKAKEAELKEKVRKEVKAELGTTEDGENLDSNKNDIEQNNGNLLKKNKILTALFLDLGLAFIVVAIIFIMAVKLTVVGVIFGVVGLIGLFVGFSAMMNRSKICPNCGECWGKEVDSKYMGSSTQIQQQRISKSEYMNNTSDNEKIVDKDGNYYERKIVTTHNYEKILQCEHCGHIWSVKEKKVEK